MISCFSLPRSSSCSASVVILVYSCGCLSKGWHSIVGFYLLLSPLRHRWVLYTRSPFNARCLRIIRDVTAAYRTPSQYFPLFGRYTSRMLVVPLHCFPIFCLVLIAVALLCTMLVRPLLLLPFTRPGLLFRLIAMSAYDTVCSLFVSTSTLRLFEQTCLKYPVSPQSLQVVGCPSYDINPVCPAIIIWDGICFVKVNTAILTPPKTL